MAQAKAIYLGIKGSVIALNSVNGQQLWATPLKSSDFVNIAFDGSNLYAATRGEIFCIDSQTGRIRWQNPLKGFGLGLVSICGEGIVQDLASLSAEKRRRDQQAAAANSAGSGSA